MMPVIPIGSLELSSYALMLSIGATIGFWLTFREIERKRLGASPMLRLAVVAFVAGLVGARGLGWLMHPELYADRPWTSILTFWDRGGMSMYGGLVLSALAGTAYARASEIPLWDAADTLVAAWVPFIALIRIGCFLNGCCYGKPTAGPFGLVAGGSPNNVNFGIPSHPTQLYDAAAAFLLFVFLWRLRLKRRFVGQLAVAFLAFYPLFRFFHEFLRGDPRIAWQFGGLGILSFNQLVSLPVMAFALVSGWYLERSARVPARAS